MASASSLFSAVTADVTKAVTGGNLTSNIIFAADNRSALASTSVDADSYSAPTSFDTRIVGSNDDDDVDVDGSDDEHNVSSAAAGAITGGVVAVMLVSAFALLRKFKRRGQSKQEHSRNAERRTAERMRTNSMLIEDTNEITVTEGHEFNLTNPENVSPKAIQDTDIIHVDLIHANASSRPFRVKLTI